MVSIKSIEYCNIDVAGYVLDIDTVFYDERLEHYPALKKMILDHELYHAKHKNSIWHHILIDIKDLTIWFRYDFFIYYFIQPDIKRTKKHANILFYYMLFNIIRMFLTIPIQFIGLVLNLFLFIYNNLKKR